MPELLQVYVGTYGKYTAGSIAGKWLALSDYTDQSEFYSACKELHKNERDPELMFQDTDGLPAGSYSESWISEQIWDFLDLEDHEKEVVLAYSEIRDFEQALQCAIDLFCGRFDTHEDFVWDWIENYGIEIPDLLCVDILGTWERNLCHGYDFTRYEGENFYFFEG